MGLGGIYIRALRSPPKSIFIKPFQNTTHQVRTEIRKGLTRATARATLLGQGGQQPGAKPFTPNQRQNGGSSSPKPHWSVCAASFPLLQTVTSLLVWQLCLPSPAAQTQQNFPRQLQESPWRTESKASIPCLIRRDAAAAWL